MTISRTLLAHVKLKHLLGLLTAFIISVLIILFSPEIRKFEQLGYFGVFLISLLGNATVILPAPVLAAVFFFGGSLPNPFLVGLAAGIGVTLGELTGFLAGYSSCELVTHSKTYLRIKGHVEKYGLFAIFLFALIPNPLFDIAGIAAGALNMKVWKFLLATGCGKLIKCLVIAYSGYYALT